MTIDSAARIQLYARIEIQGVSGHPGRKAYPGQDRITWSGYNPPVRQPHVPLPMNLVLEAYPPAASPAAFCDLHHESVVFGSILSIWEPWAQNQNEPQKHYFEHLGLAWPQI